ncbi:MAG: hypoxanthine phosphoribosyltransferase [Xenococcaceae cyanobacterium MO_207.B15]|nr:hypoxanthine phosphoribosyltransferase [Xenococcaceae cyanobacterium MO_207.B15]
MTRNLVHLISQAEIVSNLKRMAVEIDQDYQDRSVVLVGILKGSFIFLADLVRELHIPLENIEFIRLSSYGSSMVSSGQAKITMSPPREAIAGKDVVLIEDIVDTGITTDTALRYLQNYQPASLRLCALLDKPLRRQVSVKIDYLGFTVEDRFIVGYGIDFDEQYRQLSDICYLEEDRLSRNSENSINH